VTAPKDCAGRAFHPRVTVLVDTVPVGSIMFALKATKEESAAPEIALRGDRAKRYAYAFLSYASPDRPEVIKRAQGLKAGGTDFFNDLPSLEPGERWEKRLYQEIDRCDVFYLFWSSKAKASPWVMKETEYALARRARSGTGEPDIIPVIIEGPPPPTPPGSLKDIHFNDSLIYVLAGMGGASPH
jgi:TIR domain